MAFAYDEEYREYITAHGIASGRPAASYVSRLNRASKKSGVVISPRFLLCSADIARIAKLLHAKIPAKAISDITAAMKKYVEMVIAYRL